MEAKRHMLGNPCAGNLGQIACVEQQKVRVVCRCIQDHRQQYALILILGLALWPPNKHRLAGILTLLLPLPDIACQIEFDDTVKND